MSTSSINLLSWWRGLRGRVPPLPIACAVFVLFMATAFILPNAERVREARMYYFEYAVFLAAGAFVFSSVSRPVGSMLLFVGVSMGITGIIPANMALCLYAAAFFVSLVFTARFYGERATEAIYNAIGVVALLCFAWQIMQAAGVYLLVMPLPGNEASLSGLLANTNETAALYAISLPVFFRRKWFKFIPAIILGLILSKGFGGVLAASVVASIAAFRHFGTKRAAVVALGVFLSAAVFFWIVKGPAYIGQAMSAQNQRGPIWTETVRVAMFKPVLGWGIGQYKYVFPLTTSPEILPQDDLKMLYDGVIDKDAMVYAYRSMKEAGVGSPFTAPSVEAHNEYLETMFNFGIVGLCVLLAGLFFVFREAWMQADKIPLYGLMASCLCALVYFNWHGTETASITITYLSFIAAARRDIR